MQKPLVDNDLIEQIDTSRLPNWAKDSNIEEFLGKGKPGFKFIGYQDKVYGVPTVLQGDSFAYLPEKTGKLNSYAALFDPKWKGYVALEDNYTTAGQKTALYLKTRQSRQDRQSRRHDRRGVQDRHRLPHRPEEARASSASSGTVFQQAVDLIVNKEVYVIDCWEPMVFVAKSKGVDAVYADPKEGYLLWAMAAYLAKNPEPHAPSRPKAAYQLLDFMLGGWYGAKITTLRGYMTNTDAPDYAKAHRRSSSRPTRPRRWPTSPRTSAANSRQGGTWQNRWPTAGRRLRDRSGRASRRREPGRVGCGRADGGQLGRWAFLPACRSVFAGGLPCRAARPDGGGQLLGAGRARRSARLPLHVLSPSSPGRASLCSSAASLVSIEATALSLLSSPIRSPISWPSRSRPATARIVLLLFTVPFLVNYIVRDLRLDRVCSAAPARSTRC